VLLVRHVEGWWTLPGGAIDPGERPAEAARREALEEASIEIELLAIAGVFGGYPDFHGFYCERRRGRVGHDCLRGADHCWNTGGRRR
jgi:8-oxo-dGTP pyrophosphatase MutT (NUDIX family)